MATMLVEMSNTDDLKAAQLATAQAINRHSMIQLDLRIGACRAVF